MEDFNQLVNVITELKRRVGPKRTKELLEEGMRRAKGEIEKQKPRPPACPQPVGIV